MAIFFWTACLTVALVLAPGAGECGGKTEAALIDGIAVARSTTAHNGGFFRRTDTFSVTDHACRIEWVVWVPPETDTGAGGLQLATRLPDTARCPQTFPARLPLLRAGLKAVFAAWPAADFSSYICPSFASMNPEGGWNVAIAVASSRSADYADYRRHYPHHRRGTPINTLFVRIVNAAGAYGDLQALFAEYGLALTLTHVEKVSSEKVGAAKRRAAFTAAGLADDQRVLDDAASYNFRLAPRTP